MDQVGDGELVSVLLSVRGVFFDIFALRQSIFALFHLELYRGNGIQGTSYLGG